MSCRITSRSIESDTCTVQAEACADGQIYPVDCTLVSSGIACTCLGDLPLPRRPGSDLDVACTPELLELCGYPIAL